MKKEKIKNDEVIKNMVQIFYSKIFELDTKTLSQVYIDIYKELISRKDFSNLEDTKIIYEICKQRLIEEGVYNV